MKGGGKMEYIFEKENVQTLLEKLCKDDIVHIMGNDLIELLSREKGGRGRRPIEVDRYIFEETVALWQRGEITARQAMERLNLKPNTFYRRIKERNIEQMKDIKSDIRDTLKAEKKELDMLKEQVRKDVQEVKAAADERLEREIAIKKIEKDILAEKISAKAERRAFEKDVRASVESERKEFKNL